MPKAARALLVLMLLAIAGACIYAFISIFDMLPSIGGIGSAALAALLIITAALASRGLFKK